MAKVAGLPRESKALCTPFTWEPRSFAGLTVLRCDKGFDLAAAVTGQPAERLNVI